MMKYRLMALFIMAASPALAMQCMPRPLEENVKAADIVFLGKVTAREPVEYKDEDSICWQRSEKMPLCGGKIAAFTVSKWWKGAPPDQTSIRVFSNDACYCLGSVFETGKEYLVFANRTKEGEADYAVRTVCDGTTAVETTGNDGMPIITGIMRQLDELVKP
jgi:hypothetical protein